MDYVFLKTAALKNWTLLFRAWRQKIEAWLQENEKEEKQNEELRRRSRRVQNNRRSLEADSGMYSFSTDLYIVVACQVRENNHVVSCMLSCSTVSHIQAHT